MDASDGEWLVDCAFAFAKCCFEDICTLSKILTYHSAKRAISELLFRYCWARTRVSEKISPVHERIEPLM